MIQFIGWKVEDQAVCFGGGMLDEMKCFSCHSTVLVTSCVSFHLDK